MLQIWLVANTIFWTFGVKIAGITLSVNVIILGIFGVAWLWTSGKFTVASLRFLGAFVVLTTMSSLIMIEGPCTTGKLKSILTFPVLAAMIFMGIEVGVRAELGDWLKLQKTAMWAIAATLVSLVIEVLWPGWFPSKSAYQSRGLYSGFFKEPSHVAVGMFPCIAVLLVSKDRKMRRNGLIAIACLLILSRSSTLIIFIAAWIVYRAVIAGKLRSAVLLVVALGLIAGFGFTLSNLKVLAPTVTRVSGIMQVNTGSNISSMTYVRGWQDLWANVVRTHGLGLGLNMMGCAPIPDVAATRVLTLWGLGDLNAEDGSFLFSKVVSELGIIGIAFYILTIWWWIRKLRTTKLHHDAMSDSVAAIQNAMIFCFLIQSFVRSAGYFGGGLLLFVVSASGLLALTRLLAEKAVA